MFARFVVIFLSGVSLLNAPLSQAQQPNLAARRKGLNDRFLTTKGTRDDVANVEDCAVPAEGRQVPVRVYKPKGDRPFPLLVFIHGGRFFCRQPGDSRQRLSVFVQPHPVLRGGGGLPACSGAQVPDGP